MRSPALPIPIVKSAIVSSILLLLSLSPLPVVAQSQPANTMTVTDASGAGESNYPLQFGRPFIEGAIPHAPAVLVNGGSVPSQADIKNRYPDGSVEFAVMSVVIPSIPAGGSVTLSFEDTTGNSNAPLTAAQMLDPSYNFDAQEQLSGGTASARTMLANGDYTLWTSGPVAQTILLADDTPTRKYDIGFGDGFHPFRPRFEATFWPATHQVFVRAIGENGLSTELEDIGPYSLTITAGQNNPTTIESTSVSQPAMSTWTKEFWIGGAPQPEVNIDNNLAYLESTRYVSNYDPSITISQTTIANDYTTWWTGTPGGTDIGGAGAWIPGMGAGGQSDMIAPEPGWETAWLYTGDWRMRQTALGNADLAAWWPVNVRETDMNAVLNRADPTPTGGQAGSGYGKPISITYRKWIGPSLGGEGEFLYYNSCNYCTTQPNSLKIVGSLNTNNPWGFDSAHEPSPFFIPYVLSGDPFYLNEMEMWAAYDATSNQGGSADPGDNQQRGPTGAEGGAASQLRGDAWILRNRVQAAFAVPDGDPFKTYMTILTQEFIARWEGVLGVTDPALSNSPEYIWGQQTGNPHTSTGFGNPPPSPALHNWEAEPITEGQYNQDYWVSAIGETEPWMQWFVQYALGRATELGYASGPLDLSSGQYLIGIVNDTGYPKLIASYYMPSWTASGQITSWSQFVANFDQPYLTGNGYTGTGQTIPFQFANNAWGTNNYDIFASAANAMLVDENAPGAAQAQTWLQANVYQPQISALDTDPIWAIVPRTDTNVLPLQPTTETSIVVQSGSGQTAAVGSNFANPLVAIVKDGSGNPVSGTTVTFSGTTVSFPNGTTAVTDSNGQAGIIAQPTAAGPLTVIAAAAGTVAPTSFSETGTGGGSGTPASIAAVSGSGQTAAVGSNFANPLVVLVEDSSSNPVSGATVTFSGSGVSFPNGATAVTGSNGEASVTAEPTQSGTLTIDATVGGVGSPAVFSETGTNGTLPGAPSNLAATAASSSEIDLSWSASPTPGVTYSVFRSTTSGFTPGSGNQVASGISALTYNDTGLSASTTYYYLAEAVDSAGPSGASNQASATTQAGGGSNLIQDPGFESSTSLSPYWNVDGSPTGAGVDNTPSHAHSGNDSAAVWDQTSNQSFVDISQTVAVAANTSYTLTGWIDASSTTGGLFGVRTTGGININTTAIANTDPGPETNQADYRQYTVTFNSGSNTSVVVFAGYTTPGTPGSFINVDDTSLVSSTLTDVLALDFDGSGAGNYVAQGYLAPQGTPNYCSNVDGNGTAGDATIDTSGVTNPAPQEVYQTEYVAWPSIGNFTCTVPSLTPNASYTVRLHFAELNDTAPGQREFNVLINGNQVLTNFDIFAAAGAMNKAVVETFPVTADANGNIAIEYVNVVDNAIASGIEIQH